jgi:hypothetical protein
MYGQPSQFRSAHPMMREQHAPGDLHAYRAEALVAQCQAGPRTFIAGADISELEAIFINLLLGLGARRRRYTKAPMPVIALPTIRFCI